MKHKLEPLFTAKIPAVRNPDPAHQALLKEKLMQASAIHVKRPFLLPRPVFGISALAAAAAIVVAVLLLLPVVGINQSEELSGLVVRTEGQTRFELRQEIGSGGFLRMGKDESIVLSFPGVGAVQVLRESALSFTRMEKIRGANHISIDLSEGAILARFEPEPGTLFCDIRVDDVTFSIVGTTFMISRTAGSVALKVFDGTVAVSRSGEAFFPVTAGRGFSLELCDGATGLFHDLGNEEKATEYSLAPAMARFDLTGQHPEIRIMVKPDDSLIFINGKQYWQGSVQFVSTFSAPVTVEVVRAGYESQSFILETGRDYSLSITLREKETGASGPNSEPGDEDVVQRSGSEQPDGSAVDGNSQKTSFVPPDKIDLSQNDYLIVPGERVGCFPRGISLELLLETLGQPGRILNGMYYIYEKIGLSFHVDAQKEWIIEITVLSGSGKKFHFPDGYTTGKNKQAMIASLGEPSSQEKSNSGVVKYFYGFSVMIEFNNGVTGDINILLPVE